MIRFSRKCDHRSLTGGGGGGVHFNAQNIVSTLPLCIRNEHTNVLFVSKVDPEPAHTDQRIARQLSRKSFAALEIFVLFILMIARLLKLSNNNRFCGYFNSKHFSTHRSQLIAHLMRFCQWTSLGRSLFTSTGQLSAEIFVL